MFASAATSSCSSASFSRNLCTAPPAACVPYKADPDLYGADSYGLIYAYKAAVEKAQSTDTDKVRAAFADLKWQTPQGEKTLRAGDHQAVQTMYVVRVNGGKFNIVGEVKGEDAIGADTCTRF